ncbi:MAG: hypothetical protein H6729_14390 [Deltaproteobacteria bacterium]|nr:hypothetical protein [Deltaproteobacteria bacterium]
MTSLSILTGFIITNGGCAPLGEEPAHGDGTFQSEDALADATHPYRGRYRELWIGPDFVKGKASAEKDLTSLRLGHFTSALAWRETASKTSVFQFRIGFLSRLFEPRPIINRSSFGANACKRRSTPQDIDSTFNEMHALAAILRSEKIRVSVEVGATRLATWAAYRPSPGTPSVLENFQNGSESIGLGKFSAIAESHVLKCFEAEFGLSVSAIVLDNAFSLAFVRQARSTEGNLNYPQYKVGKLQGEIAEYVWHMKELRPNLFVALTEFPLDVDGASGHAFRPLDTEKDLHKKLFREDADLSLASLLSGIDNNLRTIADTAHKPRIHLDAFFIDSSFAHEAADRRYGAKPFERVLALESVAASHGLKVGLYLQSAIIDRRVCDATPHYASCGEVMRAAKLCAPNEKAGCALNEDELKDSKKGAEKKYADMTPDEIDARLGEEVSNSIDSYLMGYLRSGGNPAYFNFQTWHPFPERIGPEKQTWTWLSLATRIGRVVAPVNPPRETTPASNLYRIPKSIWLIDRARNSTCVFTSSDVYRRYLDAHGISNPVLPIFGNPPSALTYASACR